MAEKSIFDEFMVPENGPAKSAASSGDKSIFDEFMVPETKEAVRPQSAQKQALPLGRNIPGAPGIPPGLVEGYLDVAQTVNRLFKHSDKNFERTEAGAKEIRNKLDPYREQRGYDVGRVGGQMFASAPLIPGGAISTGVKTAVGAMPTKLAPLVPGGASEVIAAPMGRRIIAASGTGGVAGGMFGAYTSAGNEENTLAENVGNNALAGMVGGPVVEVAGVAASKVAPALKSAYYNTKLNYFTSKYGITPQAAKNVLSALENEGMTLQQAEAKLMKFGPDATIGDLTPALQQFVGELGKRGGVISSRAGSIVKNRYAARADTADDRLVNDVINKNLGPHKDVSLERGKVIGQAADDIHSAAELSVAGERKAAYANPTKLSVYSLIGEIDKKLEMVAGDAIPALEKARGTLFKHEKDPTTGQKVSKVRTSVEELHESRKALDDMIEKKGDSLPPRALAAVKEIRRKVDEQLKTIPEMKAHDEKFAKAMDVKEGLKIGYEALKKGNKFSFDRAYDSAPPEVQQTIREGMRASIGDHMDMAAKGDLSGAAQLFGDRNLTRHKLVKAFGAKGAETLEEIEKHIVMRATERYASTGAITSAALRTNEALDMQGTAKGPFKEAIKGAVYDAFMGTPGYIAGLRGAGAAGSNIASKVAQKRHDLNVESLADLVSKSGSDRDLGMSVVARVDKIQQKLKKSGKEIKLPVVLSAPIGDPIEDKGIKIGKYGGETVRHWINQAPSFD